MYMGLDKDGYYSLREILGYGCKYNIVLSERGRGKSYGTKRFLIEHAEKGECFMCLYRQKPDMVMAISDWVDPLIEMGYGPEQFEWEGSDEEGWYLRFNGAIVGYFRYLTQVNHIKQEMFPDNLNWIWWDEFIPLVYKKLGGVTSEGDALRAIVKTVEHDTVRTREEKGLKPVRVLMYANPFNWDNPILSYFKVRPRRGVYRVGPGIACEYLEDLPAKRSKKQTVDDFLGDEVNKNRGWEDQMAFVVKKWPKELIPYMSIRFGCKYFTLYKTDKNNKVYVREMNKHTDVMKMMGSKRPVLQRYGTIEGLQEDEDAIEQFKWYQTLKGMAYTGKMWFYDINCKFDFLNSLD